jgi:hypothetical protein
VLTPARQNSQTNRDVAVVVVHGVGSPDPNVATGMFSSALVGALRDAGTAAPMVERTQFSLPLEGVTAPPTPAGALPAEDVLLRRQLDGYTGAHPNESLIVPAHTIHTGRADLPRVDVYGAWWGDIGSFGEGAARAVLYLVRFISRIFSLGLASIEAAADATGARFWYQAEWWQRTFAHIVFGVIPTLILLIALDLTAITFGDMDTRAALAISIAVSIAVTLAALMPRIIRSGHSGPMDWFARPATYAIAIVLVLGVLLFNEPGTAGAESKWYRWVTPLHLLVVLWLFVGVLIVQVVRRFVSLGPPAPRFPATRAASRRTSSFLSATTARSRFVSFSWQGAVLIVLGDGGTILAMTLAIAFVEVVLRWKWKAVLDVVVAPQRRQALRDALEHPGVQRQAGSLAIALLVALVGDRIAVVLLAAVGVFTVLHGAIATYRAAPGPGRAAPGILASSLQLIVAWVANLYADGTSSSLPMFIVVSVIAFELFARLDAYWNAPLTSPDEEATRPRRRAIGGWLRANWRLAIIIFACGIGAIRFLTIALSPRDATHATLSGQAQSIIEALNALQYLLVPALVFSWALAMAVIIVGPIIALFITLRGVGHWATRHAKIRTIWTSVITASATLVMVLMAQAYVAHLTGAEDLAREMESVALGAPPPSVLEVQPSGQAAPDAVPGAAAAATAPADAPAPQEQAQVQAQTSQAADSTPMARRVVGTVLNFGSDAQMFAITTFKSLNDWADYQLLGLLAFGVIFAAVTVWTLIPAIRTDADPTAPPWATSVQLGRWISTGTSVLRVVAVIGIPALAIVPGALALGLGTSDSNTDLLHAFVEKLSTVTYGAILGTGFVVALSQMGAIVSVLRPVLALLADIEIYLRVAPVDRTPRARLLDRITSLITHLEQAGYKRIIVVAHSQGTVVAADALRLRARNAAQRADDGGPVAPGPRISLVTMGSPLQNLYAMAFPYLYSWVQDTDTDVDDGTVNARRAGVAQWINLYRSGDYIGRHLWSTGTDEERYADQSATVAARSASGESFDTCIGYGGHTGYWSNRAVLDAVVAQAKFAV